MTFISTFQCSFIFFCYGCESLGSILFRAFLVNSFFSALSNISNSIPFYPVHFLWKSKVPSKVSAFAWLVTHKKVNTNDMLELRRLFKTLSLDWCILCRVVRRLIISFCTVRALWVCGIGFFHKRGWIEFNQVVFVI